MRRTKLALHTSLVYAAAAAVWIFFSSKVLLILFKDPSTILLLEIYKGWGFVLVTTLLLYVTLRGQLRRWEEEADRRQRAEKKLDLHEEQKQALLAASQDGFWLVDREGNVLEVNDAACTMTGYDRGELLGMRIQDLEIRESPDAIRRRIGQILEKGAARFETRHRRKDGHLITVEVSVTSLEHDAGRIVCTCRDITLQKEAVLRLQQSEKRLRSILDNLQDAYFQSDLTGRLVFVSPSAARMFGFDSAADMEGLESRTLYNDPGIRDSVIKELLRAGRIADRTGEARRKDGTTFWVSINLQLRRDESGEVVGTEGVVRDISERRRTEELNQMLRHAIDVHFDGAYWMDARNRFVYVNEAAAKALGYGPEELLGKDLREINDRATPERMAEIWRRLREETSFSVESVHRRKDGTEYPVEIVSTYVKFGGEEFNCGFARDITERKRAENALLTTLKEKVVLLKEIHHRVKNNLQVISSLLNLQASQAADPVFREAFRDSQHRVRAMALVHEKLYASGNLASINFFDYLASVTSELSRVYGRDGVAVELRAEVILLPIDTAIPCGLIVNELVTNALKHAFPDGRTGTVVVGHRRLDERTLELSVQDDGVGAPAPADILQKPSMGITVVKSLIEQLAGGLSLETTRGAKFTVTYPG